MPPKNAKKVGAIEAPNDSRLPWDTKVPPVSALRTAKTPGPELAMPMLGANFQVGLKSSGRLMEVFQSNEVENPPVRNRLTVIESLGSGVSRFGIVTVVR